MKIIKLGTDMRVDVHFLQASCQGISQIEAIRIILDLGFKCKKPFLENLSSVSEITIRKPPKIPCNRPSKDQRPLFNHPSSKSKHSPHKHHLFFPTIHQN